MTIEEAEREEYRIEFEKFWRWEPKPRRWDWTPYQEAYVWRHVRLERFLCGQDPAPPPYEEWLKTRPPCDLVEDGPEAEERLWFHIGHGRPEKAKAEYGGKVPTFDEWWASWHDGTDGE